jgi:AcrR family transcriptional regulator
MARRPQTKPRKRATQGRSRATVDALIQATARILVREGFDKASTNRIADVAGVSVGSLYQYFPSKESLVAAVIERHREEIALAVRGELEKAATQPLDQGILTLVAMAVQAHRIDPKLHRVLAEQIPRVGRLEKVETFERENYALFKSYLQSHCDEIAVANLDLAAFIGVTSIEALTHNAVLHQPEMLADETMDALIDDATRLIVQYLKG